MHPINSRKCLNCHDFFLPDPRNMCRQLYCKKTSCRKASKVASQVKWLAKPENVDHWKGAENVQRVQEWRKANPGYSRRRGPRRRMALQDTLISQSLAAPTKAAHDADVALQDTWQQQPPLIIGLISQFTGLALQDDLVPILSRLYSKGSAVIGLEMGPTALNQVTGDDI